MKCRHFAKYSVISSVYVIAIGFGNTSALDDDCVLFPILFLLSQITAETYSSMLLSLIERLSISRLIFSLVIFAYAVRQIGFRSHRVAAHEPRQMLVMPLRITPSKSAILLKRVLVFLPSRRSYERVIIKRTEQTSNKDIRFCLP